MEEKQKDIERSICKGLKVTKGPSKTFIQSKDRSKA